MRHGRGHHTNLRTVPILCVALPEDTLEVRQVLMYRKEFEGSTPRQRRAGEKESYACGAGADGNRSAHHGCPSLRFSPFARPLFLTATGYAHSETLARWTGLPCAHADAVGVRWFAAIGSKRKVCLCDRWASFTANRLTGRKADRSRAPLPPRKYWRRSSRRVLDDVQVGRTGILTPWRDQNMFVGGATVTNATLQ
jgi:hypothetical protein